MKKNVILFVTLSLAAVSTSALAECPANLSADQMAECIVKENAGYWYTPSEESVSAQATPSKQDSATSDNHELAASAQTTALIRN